MNIITRAFGIRLRLLHVTPALVLLFVAAIALIPNTSQAAPSFTPTLTPPQVAGVPRPNHVVLAIEENHSYPQIIGSSEAPYINSLAQQGALFTNSYAIEHPSQPNYLDLFSGSNQRVTDDTCPHTFSAQNLGSELIAAGLTFAGYSEDLPAPGSTVCDSGGYARRHNPWVNFTNVPSGYNLPFTYYPSDYTTLPTISFVVPNVCNDMHDCSIRQGDTWLQQHIGPYVQWAMTHNSLFILTFDEDDDTDNNWIPTIFVGPMVIPGQYPEQINHYNVLRTMEDMYDLPHAGNSANVLPITDVWVSGTPIPTATRTNTNTPLPSTNSPTRTNTRTRTPTRTSTRTRTPLPTPTFTQPPPTNTRIPTSTPLPGCQEVVWTNMVNVTATGNSIQKTGGAPSTWDAGAVSTRAILAGNGYAQATVDDAFTTTYKLFGLSNGDSNPTQTDVDFALFMAGGTLKVYEHGLLRANVGTYAAGDVLKVAVESGVVRYYRNGALLYTSATPPTYPLLVDTSINSLGGRITNVYICGSNLGPNSTYTPAPTNTATNTATNTPTNTPTSTPLPGCQEVAWTNMVNVTATGNTIQKTGGTPSTWDAGAVSTKSIISGNGYALARVDALNTYRMFGLSNGDSSPHFSDIDFAAYLAGSTLMVYERGAYKGSFGSLAVGDVVRVSVESGVVRYYRNGTLLYTSAALPTYPLLLDTAINSSLGRISNAYICGANLGP